MTTAPFSTSTARTRPAPKTVGEVLRYRALPLAAAFVCAVAFAWPALLELLGFWSSDPDYSHGFLVPLVAAAIIASRRRRLAELSISRPHLGALTLFLALLAFALGHATVTPFFSRLSVWGLLVGSLGFLFGNAFLRETRFPLLYLLFAVPPPQKVLHPLKLELKELATRASADLLSLGGYAARPEGNVLSVGSRLFEVADACSGIRSLVAILATATLFAWAARSGWWKGLALVACAVPITVAVNIGRILILVVAWSSWGIDLTTGFLHELLGYAVFASSLVLLWAAWRGIEWLSRWQAPFEEEEAA